jgi:hypothetical protein
MNLVFLGSFFVPKSNHKEVFFMFSDEILEKIFGHPEMQKIPIGCQSTAVSVFDNVLDEIRKENPYGTISELFSDTATI